MVWLVYYQWPCTYPSESGRGWLGRGQLNVESLCTSCQKCLYTNLLIPNSFYTFSDKLTTTVCTVNLICGSGSNGDTKQI